MGRSSEALYPVQFLKVWCQHTVSTVRDRGYPF
jgi:hypothetical protein